MKTEEIITLIRILKRKRRGRKWWKNEKELSRKEKKERKGSGNEEKCSATDDKLKLSKANEQEFWIETIKVKKKKLENCGRRRLVHIRDNCLFDN